MEIYISLSNEVSKLSKFIYKVRNNQGKLVNGSITEKSQTEAVAALRDQGYFIIQIKEAPKSTLSQISKSLTPKKVKLKYLALLARQFAIQLEAGLSLVMCLQLLEEQTDDQRLASSLNIIRLDVSSGMSFSNAINKHRDVFPHEFIHLIEAGELAGELPAVFNQLAIYYEREDELRKKVAEALMYPMIIGVVAVLVVFALLFIVLPMLITSFSSFGVEVPWITQVVLDARDVVVRYWYAFLGGLIAVIFFIRWYLITPLGKLQKDTLALKLPALGELNKMVIFSRFCRVLGLLLSSGISMVKSLDIVARLVENVVISNALEESHSAVERGEGLTDPIRQNKIFPTMLVQMIAVGEETGSLELTLEHLSNYYDKEVNFAVAAFTKLLEPLMILVLAVVVIFILVSVYMPMMQMMGQL